MTSAKKKMTKNEELRKSSSSQSKRLLFAAADLAFFAAGCANLWFGTVAAYKAQPSLAV